MSGGLHRACCCVPPYSARSDAYYTYGTGYLGAIRCRHYLADWTTVYNTEMVDTLALTGTDGPYTNQVYMHAVTDCVGNIHAVNEVQDDAGKFHPVYQRLTPASIGTPTEYWESEVLDHWENYTHESVTPLGIGCRYLTPCILTLDYDGPDYPGDVRCRVLERGGSGDWLEVFNVSLPDTFADGFYDTGGARWVLSVSGMNRVDFFFKWGWTRGEESVSWDRLVHVWYTSAAWHIEDLDSTIGIYEGGFSAAIDADDTLWVVGFHDWWKWQTELQYPDHIRTATQALGVLSWSHHDDYGLDSPDYQIPPHIRDQYRPGATSSAPSLIYTRTGGGGPVIVPKGFFSDWDSATHLYQTPDILVPHQTGMWFDGLRGAHVQVDEFTISRVRVDSALWEQITLPSNAGHYNA